MSHHLERITQNLGVWFQNLLVHKRATLKQLKKKQFYVIGGSGSNTDLFCDELTVS